MFHYQHFKNSVCQNICRDIDCFNRCTNVNVHFVPYRHLPFYHNYTLPNRFIYRYPHRHRHRHRHTRRRH